MPRSPRLTMTAAVALVLAVPALGAFAQEGLGDNEPAEQTSPSAAPTPDWTGPTPELSPTPEDDPTPEDSPRPQDLPTPGDGDAPEVAEDDEAHGAVVSAAAQCLPSGKALHGTGFNKGMLMRAVAQSAPVTVGAVEFEVGTPEEAAALCRAVEELAATTDAPAKGSDRPGNAKVSGPPDHAPGPPDHAPAHGRRGHQRDD